MIIPDDLKEVLIGILLGDGHIVKRSSTANPPFRGGLGLILDWCMLKQQYHIKSPEPPASRVAGEGTTGGVPGLLAVF